MQRNVCETKQYQEKKLLSPKAQIYGGDNSSYLTNFKYKGKTDQKIKFYINKQK